MFTMSKKKNIKSYYKNLKIIQKEDICKLEQAIDEYRSESKANWKEFKFKMELEIKRITKSFKTLRLHNGKKKLEEYLLGIIEPSLHFEKKIAAKDLLLSELSNSVPVTHH